MNMVIRNKELQEADLKTLHWFFQVYYFVFKWLSVQKVITTQRLLSEELPFRDLAEDTVP